MSFLSGLTPLVALGWRGVQRYRGPVDDDCPVDPWMGDPTDPAAVLDDDSDLEPLTPGEREDVLADLADLEVYHALLAPKGIRGLVVDCEDCHQPHYFGWDLLRSNLRQLLDHGRTRVHEPAFNPDPRHYVSWDYARGYADAVADEAADH
jgi:hypothetical protein